MKESKTDSNRRRPAAEAKQLSKSVRSYAPPVIQRDEEEIDAGIHGTVDVIKNQFSEMTPDLQNPGNTTNILGVPVATSNEVLITPNHPQGSAPGKSQDALFERLPTTGKYKLPANKNKTAKSGSTLYIKGHLINDNLGGKGEANNLFPITHQANVDHDRKVEEPIKDSVNKKGAIVYYKVVASQTGHTKNTDLVNKQGQTLKSINGRFVCTIKEFYADTDTSPKTSMVTINSTWGGTDNSDVDTHTMLDADFAKVDNLQADKVKIMPRAKLKQAWDMAYTQIANHLASQTGINLQKWLQSNVKGIGKMGAKLMAFGADYNKLSKGGKSTLTKSRNALKKYVNEHYKVYLRVEGAQIKDDAVSDLDKLPTNTSIDNLKQDVAAVENSLDSFEKIIESEFQKLEIMEEDESFEYKVVKGIKVRNSMGLEMTIMNGTMTVTPINNELASITYLGSKYTGRLDQFN